MPARVAVLQSNYIPWKGYFDLLGAVDDFILYDDAQFTKNDWRNRNRIKSPQGAQWLSLAVHGSMHMRIRDVAVCDPACGRQHWKRLAACYSRAPCFDEVASWLQPLYCERDWPMLSGVNRMLIEAICTTLAIPTRITCSSDYELPGDRNERLLALCRQVGASTYVSGPAAKSYLDVAAFTRAGVQVEWFDYAGYPPYPQLWGGPFVHELSILDLLFNCGPASRRFMKLAAQ